MKKLLIFSLLVSVVALLHSCRKEDNPKLPGLTQVPLVVMTTDATSDAFISPVNPSGFKTKFTLDLLFQNDIKPQKVDVVVMKNGNTGNVKLIKPDITTLPATVEITGQQLIAAFGPMAGGDQFDIGLDVTLAGGQKLLAFPATGESYASGLLTQIGNVKPNAVTSLQYLMPCPFNADAYAGNFEVLQDEWNDYAVGTVIPVTKVSANQISFQYNSSFMDPGTSKPIILTINPADNSITVTKQQYGTYTGDDTYFAESVPGSFSTVNPCEVSLSVRLRHTTAAGFSSPRTIRLKKK